MKIILSTLNAAYIHSAFGLRYLHANMGSLGESTIIREFTTKSRPMDIVESLLAEKPTVIGLSIYIWNVEQSKEVVSLLKKVAPEVIIVLGGPEVSYEYDEQEIVQLADYTITGWGDVSFRKLCEGINRGYVPKEKIIKGEQAALSDLAFPYLYYTDEDIAHRIVYVEASRGCPFKCEFCLSSLDKTAWAFDLNSFLIELEKLYLRGARHFKFVDRTFNLKIDSSLRILDFFLEKGVDDLFLHFEVIPDNLPERLKEKLKLFPEGCLQLEIGIQSFDPEVQSLINRRQDNGKSMENLRWLRENTQAHLHVDLIFGLPGDDLQRFGKSFDQLVELNPQEIQVGILKRLRGTPIARHTKEFGMRYNPNPPYNILCTDRIDFSTMQRVNRFARYWDMFFNSGRFVHARSYVLGDASFERFLRFSDWVYANINQTHEIALSRRFTVLYRALTRLFGMDSEETAKVLLKDFQRSGLKGAPPFIEDLDSNSPIRKNPQFLNSRQKRHLQRVKTKKTS